MALEVIGAGLGRTGTMSLKVALEQLGLGPCHHMTELPAHPERWPCLVLMPQKPTETEEWTEDVAREWWRLHRETMRDARPVDHDPTDVSPLQVTIDLRGRSQILDSSDLL